MNARQADLDQLIEALAELQAGNPPWLEDKKNTLLSAIDLALLKDQPRLRRWANELCDAGTTVGDKTATQKKQRFFAQLSASLKTVAERQSAGLTIEFDESLPISALVSQIREGLTDNQVIIVAGETGSGKTTQLPKICLQLGRGVRGQIGHTQPRRIAARTVALRVAEELGVEPGSAVGYQFRFADRWGSDTRLKVMTDGILLAEIASDKLLLNYDTLIIDEAHERSLNIDFLLGYIKGLLPKRPHLKVILTSATIDVDRFSRYFDNAPVIPVEGRSYPVEMRYREPEAAPVQGGSEDRSQDRDEGLLSLADQVRTVLEEIDDHRDAAHSVARDVLVFLPGESEIRDVSKHLRKRPHQYDVLPLYARLTQAEQQRVFQQNRSVRRRVILATNVAETSVTVPGIGYVIDTGQARVSRFSARSKIQRLQVEAISQASARQRAGRCGRISPGVCYRLYSEEDFNNRPEFTEPEILRTRLASVILQMKWLGLGDIEKFPFIEAPTQRQINNGLKTLTELGALEKGSRLSSLGKQLAQLPLDPAHGRMLIAAGQKKCLAELLVIVSALAVQDPREFPAEARQAAEQKHRRFWHPKSDFLAWLNLWIYYEEQRQQLSQNRLRKLCQKEFLSFARMREWRDLHRQLLQAVKQNRGFKSANAQDRRPERDSLNELNYELANKKGEQADDPATLATGGLCRAISPALYENIHCSILMGLPLQIGNRFDASRSGQSRGAGSGGQGKNSSYEYRGVSSGKFFVFPGSSQFKKPPQWVLASEITETRKVYARGVGQIEPQWVLHNLPHLLKFQFSEPVWDSIRGQVIARRSSTLYGLPVVNNEIVHYEKVDASASRHCFIREALVNQQLQPDKKLAALALFWQRNQAVLAELATLEDRLRNRALMPDESRLFEFYEREIPANVCSRASLYHWLKAEKANAGAINNALTLNREDLLEPGIWNRAGQQFPDSMQIGNRTVSLCYRFEPGETSDGITARIPLDMLPSLPLYRFDWMVPGILGEKVVEMLRLLPKAQRKQLLPLPAAAEKVLSAMDVARLATENRPLVNAVAEQLAIYYSVRVDTAKWQRDIDEKLDSYYRMHFEILDADNKVIREGKSISVVQHEMLQAVEDKIESSDTSNLEKKNIQRWDFGELSIGQAVVVEQSGVSAFPALLDCGDSVSMQLLSHKADAEVQSRDGVLRLAMLVNREQTRYLKKQLRKVVVPVLPYVSIGNHAELIDDVIKAAISHCCFNEFTDGLPGNETDFLESIGRGKSEVVAIASEIESLLHDVLKKYQQCCETLQKKRALFPLQCDDVQAQLESLLFPGFLGKTGLTRLRQLPRYLEAILVRFDRLGGNLAFDQENCEKLSSYRELLENLLYKYPHALNSDSNVSHFRWLLEELRVSLFAQRLKTPIPVSYQRLGKAWEKIDQTLYPLAGF